jgi:hypothetical protein
MLVLASALHAAVGSLSKQQLNRYSLLAVIVCGSFASRENVTPMVVSCVIGRLPVALSVAASDTTPCADTPVAVISMGVAPASMCSCWIGCVKAHSTDAPGNSAAAVQVVAVALVLEMVPVKATRVLPVFVKLKPFVQSSTSAAADTETGHLHQHPAAPAHM